MFREEERYEKNIQFGIERIISLYIYDTGDSIITENR